MNNEVVGVIYGDFEAGRDPRSKRLEGAKNHGAARNRSRDYETVLESGEDRMRLKGTGTKGSGDRKGL